MAGRIGELKVTGKRDTRRIAEALEGIQRALEQRITNTAEYKSKWIKLNPKTGKPFEAPEDTSD